MKIISLQLANRAELVNTKRPKMSGINKRPARSVDVDEFGIVGDTIVDTDHHGGREQAVYVYANDDYAWWSERFGLPADERIAPGTFGENITVDSFGDEVHIGDRFAFDSGTDGGDVILEATSARIPCDTFSARIGRPDWIREFRDARRPGVYCRVISGGPLTVGAAGSLVADRDRAITVLDTQDLFYDGAADRATEWIERAITAPVQDETRTTLQAELDRRSG